MCNRIKSRYTLEKPHTDCAFIVGLHTVIHIFMLHYNNYKLDDIDGEIWVDAIFHDGYYVVSNYGRLKSLSRTYMWRNTEKLTKEKILRQNISKIDGRLSAKFNSKTINISAIIYYSFNPEQYIEDRHICIMHKNKLASDNRLSNLKQVTLTESHELNFKKGLLPHLGINNKIKHNELLKIETRICKDCNEEKPISKFKYGSFLCFKCKYHRSSIYKQSLIKT